MVSAFWGSTVVPNALPGQGMQVLHVWPLPKSSISGMLLDISLLWNLPCFSELWLVETGLSVVTQGPPDSSAKARHLQTSHLQG